ncbi:MAG: stalk domain-containing protein [Bacillota bacterium]
MRKKYLALLVSVMLIISLALAGMAFAEEATQPDSGTTTENVGSQPAEQQTEQPAEQPAGEPAEVPAEQPAEEPVEDSDNSPVVTDESLSNVENTDPAVDIIPADDGTGNLPEPLQGSWEDLTNLADQVDKEMAGAGAGPAAKLHALIMQLKGTKGWDAAHLVAVSQKIKVATQNHLRYIKTHPKAERAIILMTDETVRLAHRYVKNDRVKAVVYKNAVQTYSMLGAYKRAAAIMERALKASSNRSADYDNLKQLYKKTGSKGLKVFVRGQRPNFDVKPTVQSGRTMVPIRAISEAMGAKVNYDARQQKVMINNGGIDINLSVNNKSAIVNGKRVNLDAPAQVINGRTMVPLRFVSENLGAKVNWDGETETITVE